MKVNTIEQHDFTSQQLAKALADSSPSEFAEFWFQFSEEIKKKDDHLECNKTLHLFAQALAPSHGANRKLIFKNLHQLIGFYEVKNELEVNPMKLDN